MQYTDIRKDTVKPLNSMLVPETDMTFILFNDLTLNLMLSHRTIESTNQA